jgi:membrane protease YdiL (CAAX protease family)
MIKQNIGLFWNKQVALLLFFFLYVFSIVLLYFKIIPYDARNITLALLTVLMIAYCFIRKLSLKELGFTTKHLKGSLLLNGLYSVITIIGLYVFYQLNLIRKPVAPEYDLFFVYYIFISCPCQEFLYRSLVYAELKRRDITGYRFILISALNYSFLHFFYHDWITLVATFIGGIIWGFIYNRYPNYWGVLLSHAVLGVISMVVGLI